MLLLSVGEVREGGVATFRRLPLPAPRRRGGPAPPKVYADVSSVPALVGGTVSEVRCFLAFPACLGSTFGSISGLSRVYL